MDDRIRTLAAITIIIGFFVALVLAIGILITRKNIVSPIPEDSPIKIIILSPSPPSADIPAPTNAPAGGGGNMP